jgi:hypothetical protein
MSARAPKRPVPRRIPAVSGRTPARRAMAPRAFRPPRLLRRVTPAMNPQNTPRRNNPRARRLFLRAAADAVNAHVAAMMATASSRAIRCGGPSDPMRNLRAVVCSGRWPDPTSVIAGPAVPTTVCDQSVREALAVRARSYARPPRQRLGPTSGGSGRRRARTPRPVPVDRRGGQRRCARRRLRRLRTLQVKSSPVEIPLPEIGREDLVDIDADTAQDDTRVGRGHDHRLIEHRRGLALTVRPRLRLPRPRVSRSG